MIQMIRLIPSRVVHISSHSPLLRIALTLMLLAVIVFASRITRADDTAMAYVPDPADMLDPPANAANNLQEPNFRGWTDADCNGCHTTQAGYSHPVNVKPPMAVPSHLPLVAGRVACITCHDNSSAAAHAQARQSHTPLLRQSTAANFCTQCHNPGDSSHSAGRASMHGAMLGKAHLRKPAYVKQFAPLPAARSDFASTFGNSILDAASQSCLTCHDGSLAADVSTGSGAGSVFNSSFNAARDHPMGMTYPTRPQITTSSGGFAPFRPFASLDPRITLIDNKIGCLSCHSPYSTEDHLLVMPNTRSALCLACHADN
ncbi:MAG: cytochrome c3 family protein [Phycisphaerales bacterium]